MNVLTEEVRLFESFCTGKGWASCFAGKFSRLFILNDFWRRQQTFLTSSCVYRYAHASGRSRFCAVALSDTVFAILGGETDEAMATPTMKTYDVENEEWITQPEMAQNRKDHACLVIEIDGNRGEAQLRQSNVFTKLKK